LYVEDYFDDLVKLLEQHAGGVFERPLDVRQPDPEFALFSNTLRLPNGWRLDIALAVDMREPPHFPNWIEYAVHLRDERDATIWRYDNIGYHPEIETHPHHMHEGSNETLRPGRLESARDIVRVLEETLGK
jgi:hypothetical protein